MHMMAIETRYRGYRFRSRLEARWAVFFDALGLRWEYEPQGFAFPSQPFRETDGGMSFAEGGAYLPDFRVTWPGRWPGEGGSYWCEVKPGPLSDRERELCELLVINTQDDCILLIGPPEPRVYTALTPVEGSLAAASVDVLIWSSKGRVWWTPSDEDERLYTHEDGEYMAAVYAARSARFEHGESGRG